MSVTIFAKLKVKAGSEAVFEAAAKEMIAAVRANEPGTTAYVLHKSNQDPTSYWFYETYVDQASVDLHGKTAHMKAFGGKIGAALDGRPEVTLATELDRR
jgi:quinol monooxygenase YgiN